MSFSWFSHKRINVLNYTKCSCLLQKISLPPPFPQVLSPPCIKDPRVELFQMTLLNAKKIYMKKTEIISMTLVVVQNSKNGAGCWGK